MSRPIINLSELEFSTFGKGNDFEAGRAPVSGRIGARKLGYSVIRVAPGKRAWPYHAHLNNEEMFFVLEGEGTLRHADEEYPIKAGDFIAAPPDPKQPHQIINSSNAELLYVALGTAEPIDVFLYPDSGKYGAWQGDIVNPRSEDNFIAYARLSDKVDYWDGEVD